MEAGKWWPEGGVIIHDLKDLGLKQLYRPGISLSILLPVPHVFFTMGCLNMLKICSDTGPEADRRH